MEVVIVTNKEQHDVIIIGAGAAGLSAGLVLARAQATVAIIDAGNPRNGPAAQMHGFVSRDGLSPSEFLAIARDEVVGYGATVRYESVEAITRNGDGSFAVTLSTGVVASARALLLATGLKDELPHLDGVHERWGTLVYHCPYCHGFEVLNQAIVVIGGPVREMSIKQSGLLRKYSDRVTFATNGIKLTAAERHRLEAFGVTVVDGAVSHIVGQPGELDGIALVDGTQLACKAVFIAPPQRPNDGLLRSLGCAVDPNSGFVAVNPMGQTSVPGVWAAGNVVTPTAQVITAAGAGSASAIAINGWLLNKDLDDASGQVTAQASAPKPPSVHARAIITWIAIFPLVTLGFFAIAPFAAQWNPVLRAFVLSVVVVPLAVYLVVPQLMKIYGRIRSSRR